jgi:hypothetical protein
MIRRNALYNAVMLTSRGVVPNHLQISMLANRGVHGEHAA